MHRHAEIRDLPPRLELECLKTLWNLQEASVRDIQERISLHRPLAYTTVMTIMDRLARRGFVQRQKCGRSFVYSAILTQEYVRKLAVQDLVQSHFDGCQESLRQYLLD